MTRTAKNQSPPTGLTLGPAQETLAVSISDACRIIGLGRSSIYREIQAGRLVALKAGNRTILPVAGLRAWIEALPQSKGQR
jgi:excisionase family DNA binding protein